jgi:hypothetical protein
LVAGTVGADVEATVVVGVLTVPVEFGVVAELVLDFDELLEPPHAASTSDVATARQ